MAEGAERKIAASAEGVEDDALGVRGEGSVGTVESGYGRVDGDVLLLLGGAVGTSGFERERALAGRGTELVDGEALVDVLRRG